MDSFSCFNSTLNLNILGNHLSTPWKHVESPPYRSSWYICPSQDNSALRLIHRHFPTTLMPSRSSTRPFQGLSCIHFTSSVDIPFSLFYFLHPPTAIGPFPAYRLPPPLTTSSLETYINLDPSVARPTYCIYGSFSYPAMRFVRRNGLT
jgi:hypothetical protein